MKAHWKKYSLNFKRPAGTSRGTLLTKDSYFIIIETTNHLNLTGYGECGILRGLSADDRPGYEDKLEEVCRNIQHYSEHAEELREWPSIQFGLQQALMDLGSKGSHSYYPTSDFAEGMQGIPINGLIWMGDADYMKQQIKEKLEQGYRCIKMKIGAIDFEEELSLLKGIRQEYGPETIELRVDANGAFSPKDAMEKLKRLSEFQLHSIEQPIKQGQQNEMAKLCKNTPLPIALDEELIGVFQHEEKVKLLEEIRPQYIILKPSFLGNLEATGEWIWQAEKLGIGWWITSALESNLGLSAIAQFTAQLGDGMVHGLGTGQLYTNNIPSPLYIENGQLWNNPNASWDLSSLTN